MEKSQLHEYMKNEVQNNLFPHEVEAMFEAGLSDEQLLSREDPHAELSESQKELFEDVYKNHFVMGSDVLMDLHVMVIGDERYVVKQQKDVLSTIKARNLVLADLKDRAEGNEFIKEHVAFLEANPVSYSGLVTKEDVEVVKELVEKHVFCTLPLFIGVETYSSGQETH